MSRTVFWMTTILDSTHSLNLDLAIWLAFSPASKSVRITRAPNWWRKERLPMVRLSFSICDIMGMELMGMELLMVELMVELMKIVEDCWELFVLLFSNLQNNTFILIGYWNQVRKLRKFVNLISFTNLFSSTIFLNLSFWSSSLSLSLYSSTVWVFLFFSRSITPRIYLPFGAVQKTFQFCAKKLRNTLELQEQLRFFCEQGDREGAFGLLQDGADPNFLYPDGVRSRYLFSLLFINKKPGDWLVCYL